MESKNLFKRIWDAIVLFIKTITGIELRDSLNDFILKFEDAAKQASKTAEAMQQLNLKTFQMIYRIRMRAFFPILVNERGKAVNLSMQRDMKAEYTYDPSAESLNAELFVDRDKFAMFRIDLDDSYANHPAKPLMRYAKEKFIERDRDFMNRCQYNFILSIYALAFETEYLTHLDILEVLGKSIVETAKPDYVKANDLDGFDIQKGPIEKKKIEKVEKMEFHSAGVFPANDDDEIKTNEA